jgi:hypothetical protein
LKGDKMMFKTNMRVELFLFGLLLSFCFCLVCMADDNVSYEKMILEAAQERGIATDKNIVENSRRYYKQMFGEHFEYMKTGYIFFERACNRYPIAPEKIDVFKDMIFAPFTSLSDGMSGLPVWKRPYFHKKYWPDAKLMPSRYFLAKNQLLSDMLYWEWQVDNVKFRALESNEGMLLWIIPNDFDPQKGISSKECAEILLKTTRINCKDTEELQKKFQLHAILKEGDVFTNINNFEKLVNAKVIGEYNYNEFPIPTDPDHWSKQLVGFISKDGICLILVHGRFPIQSIPMNPTILDDRRRWLSGRILHKSDKMPVLPRGVTKIPESWKPVLEDNIKCERWGLEMAEKNRIEEAKWRIWKDKNGKPFYNGLKMRFWYWEKRPSEFMKSFLDATDYPAASHRDGTVVLEYRYVDEKFGYHEKSHKEIPLSQFCDEDKKLIKSVPPQKWKPPNKNLIGLPREEDKPKEPEPEKDDIE